MKNLVLTREVPEVKGLENSQSMNFAKKRGGVEHVPKMWIEKSSDKYTVHVNHLRRRQE